MSDKPAVWFEKRWPKRGQSAPFCASCNHRAQYVHHVGMVAFSSLCAKHVESRKADLKAGL